MAHLIIVALGAGIAAGIAFAWALLPAAAVSPLAGALGWTALVGSVSALAAAGDRLRRRRQPIPPTPITPRDDRRDEIHQLLLALDRLHRSRDAVGESGQSRHLVTGE
jgi:hypothetical protein